MQKYLRLFTPFLAITLFGAACARQPTAPPQPPAPSPAPQATPQPRPAPATPSVQKAELKCQEAPLITLEEINEICGLTAKPPETTSAYAGSVRGGCVVRGKSESGLGFYIVADYGQMSQKVNTFDGWMSQVKRTYPDTFTEVSGIGDRAFKYAVVSRTTGKTTKHLYFALTSRYGAGDAWQVVIPEALREGDAWCASDEALERIAKLLLERVK